VTKHPELIEKLEEGIKNLTTSEEWQHYLASQARFSKYSFGNAMLIAWQRPTATQVAGFRAWQKMGRQVRKGEKAIWILAPMVYKVTDPKDGEERVVIRGFKSVPVFDVAQTDGDDLPTVCNRLQGDDPDGLFDTLVSVAESIGYRVEVTILDAGINGDCTYSERRIRVETRNTPAQRVKTLAHELAHALLHEDRTMPRALAELEAESVAYIVCQALGIDSGDYSFGYVATWAGGGEAATAAIKASCGRIQTTAAKILAEAEADDLAETEAA